jgi:hypothetical protein
MDVQGRGQIDLAEQPDEQNNYTAKVRIVDPQPGAGAYSFTLAWDDDTRGGYRANSGGGILSPNGNYRGNGNYSDGAGSARWSGQVDGRVRVSFRGNQAFSERLSAAKFEESRRPWDPACRDVQSTSASTSSVDGERSTLFSSRLRRTITRS